MADDRKPKSLQYREGLYRSLNAAKARGDGKSVLELEKLVRAVDLARGAKESDIGFGTAPVELTEAEIEQGRQTVRRMDGSEGYRLLDDSKRRKGPDTAPAVNKVQPPATLASVVNNSALGKEYGPDLPPKASGKESSSEPLPSTPKKASPTDTGKKSNPSPLTGLVSNVPKQTAANNSSPAAPGTTGDGATLTAGEQAEADYLATFDPDKIPKRKSVQTAEYDTAEDRRLAKESLERSQNIATYGELAANIGRSIARYAAASRGLKEGIDLSNLDLEKADFSNLVKNAVERYQADVADSTQKRKETQDKIDRERQANQDEFTQEAGLLGERRAGLKAQIDFFNQKEAAARAKEAEAENLRRWNREIALKEKEVADRLAIATNKFYTAQTQSGKDQAEKGLTYGLKTNKEDLDRIDKKETPVHVSLGLLEDIRTGVISTKSDKEKAAENIRKGLLGLKTPLHPGGMTVTDVSDAIDKATNANAQAWRFGSFAENFGFNNNDKAAEDAYTSLQDAIIGSLEAQRGQKQANIYQYETALGLPTSQPAPAARDVPARQAEQGSVGFLSPAVSAKLTPEVLEQTKKAAARGNKDAIAILEKYNKL
jgi:hypothetical protein